jgi:hypothetical protein
MQVTVTIDDDVCVKVNQMAEESGHTFGQIISRLARSGLRVDLSHPSKEKAESSGASQSAVFRILVGAAIVPGNRSGQLMGQTDR